MFPRLVPVFPLPGCVLFPGAVLPLHVYEPRYRAMARGVLEKSSDDRLIAIALLRPGFQDLYQTPHAPIHHVVCVGRVIEHEQLADDRFNLLLLGFSRAVIVGEDQTGEFRKAHVSPLPSAGAKDASTESELREAIGELMKEATDEKLIHPAVVNHLLANTPRLEHCIDLLTYHLLPAEDSELKQRVLEENNVSIRVRILTRWLRNTIDEHKYARDTTRAWPPEPSPN